jgi:nitroimidazol reductase NimA-like FMN-containing flavoprotein (pyridoxamine 5'-phosphate oxidase superfamily)
MSSNPPIYQLPKMSEAEIDQIIQKNALCRIAYLSGEYPYISPFQYAVVDGTLYFHFTDYGRKKAFLEQDSKVCVEIEDNSPDLARYCFISLRGHLSLVKSHEERLKVIRALVENAKIHFSPNFLAAHGFDKIDCWDAMVGQDSLKIIRLERIIEKIGLKSPD